MKKTIFLAGIMAAAMFVLAACGSNSGETTAPQTTGSVAEQTTEAVTATAAEKETPSQETTQAKPKVSQEEVEAFAEQIQEAFADQNLETLSQLITYPIEIYYPKGQSESAESVEEFMDIDPEYLFGENLLKVVAGVDTSTLSMGPAGVSMGEGETSVIFDVSDEGTLGITEIHE